VETYDVVKKIGRFGEKKGRVITKKKRITNPLVKREEERKWGKEDPGSDLYSE